MLKVRVKRRKVRPRDPEGSRTAILDTAEALFAERGYQATSLEEVGRRAGVSRGTPGYFFGSKERLYRAVLDRVFSAARSILGQAQERAAATGGSPEALLREGINAYVDFLASRPTFVRLVEWETLGGGRFLGKVPAHLAGLEEALAVSRAALAQGHFRPVDPTHLLISAMGLCWFPFAHAETLVRWLGADQRTPAFLEARKRHVVDLMLNGILPRSS
ncbi:MAG: TetR family transcriptional regulator [Armatimonadetes bacterium]|nr:TetR family transcriptional regulator [Armatimonadota bacterium]